MATSVQNIHHISLYDTLFSISAVIFQENQMKLSIFTKKNRNCLSLSKLCENKTFFFQTTGQEVINEIKIYTRANISFLASISLHELPYKIAAWKGQDRTHPTIQKRLSFSNN